MHIGPFARHAGISAHAGGCVDPARRRFVTGVAAGGSLLALGPWQGQARAASAGVARELTGTDFDLSIGATPVDFTGRTRPAITVNGTLPGPVLRWRQGDSVTLRVSNRLPEHYTSIHWHGILLPANMDGVPGLSFDGIGPGETFTYRFSLRQAGTYWYHSHSLFQEQAGLYGALIVDPAEPLPYSWDREHVVVLSDWTDLDPGALFRRLKKHAEYDNYYQPTVGDFFRDVRANGWRETVADRAELVGEHVVGIEVAGLADRFPAHHRLELGPDHVAERHVGDRPERHRLGPVRAAQVVVAVVTDEQEGERGTADRG